MTICIYYFNMTATLNPLADSRDIWQRYAHNLPRHLLGVSRYVQTATMNQLQRHCGHRALRLGFAPYITLIGQQGIRLSDLAATLGISRQACNQAANQIEAAGYIMRTADPDDGRAKQLSLTGNGIQLREDGARILVTMDNEFINIAGADATADAGRTLAKLYSRLELELATDRSANAYPLSIGALLPGISGYLNRRLMLLTQARGHPGLKLSFGQVLTLIGPAGGRIQKIANLQNVSKQAISAIAGELELLGYLRRDPDPDDARQLVLQFTDEGRGLIADSVASVDELESELSAIAGKASMARLRRTLCTLYSALHLEQEIFAPQRALDLALLADKLRRQLGRQDSQLLAALLIEQAHEKQGLL
jgi:DNA-binding MarR family transcriptional regulator